MRELETPIRKIWHAHILSNYSLHQIGILRVKFIYHLLSLRASLEFSLHETLRAPVRIMQR